MLAARSAARSSPLVWRGRRLSDAAKRRDPTRSNDIRRRIATGLRQSLATWRSQLWLSVVENDLLGYDYGDVPDDPEEIEDLIDRLDILLHRQAEFAFTPGADNMDVMLRTAYARGVRRAGEEVVPVLPLTLTSTELILRARRDLENALEDQITTFEQKLREEELAAAAGSSRYKLYSLALLPLLLRPLYKRLTAISTTNVTRAFNAGKIDAYEAQGIETVGIEAETQPGAPQHEWELPEVELPEPERTRQEIEFPERGEPTLPEGRRFPQTWTVETMGDDKVCIICESYEGNSYTLDEARELIPAHPNCRCSIVPLT